MNKKLLLIGCLAVTMPLTALAGVDGPTRATFTVAKFYDGSGQENNDGEVEVTISCNTGLPLEQSASIQQGLENAVVFVVESFDENQLDCAISEAVPAGYYVGYNASETGDGGASDDEDGCEFTGFDGDDTGRCHMTNFPTPIRVNIAKEWVVANDANLNGVSTAYCITLQCDTFVDNSNGEFVGYGTTKFCNEDDSDTTGDDWWAEIEPEYEDESDSANSPDCTVAETVYDNSVESSNDCQVDIAIAGEEYSCTVTNTVFFEGIPTLNPYGLAVLMLSMLGLGFVAYRRFA